MANDSLAPSFTVLLLSQPICESKIDAKNSFSMLKLFDLIGLSQGYNMDI